MANLRVDTNGLNRFADVVGEVADVVRAALSTGASGPGFQASSVAVTSSDGRVGAASLAMGDRIAAFGTTVRGAASAYGRHDDGSARALSLTLGGGA